MDRATSHEQFFVKHFGDRANSHYLGLHERATTTGASSTCTAVIDIWYV